ncbi:MAG: hypothetical protein JWO82_1266 [Akkermansiaceae bacterium]|nr:hypothetical protein [Akkermansiaceae bacterium]
MAIVGCATLGETSDARPEGICDLWSWAFLREGEAGWWRGAGAAGGGELIGVKGRPECGFRRVF